MFRLAPTTRRQPGRWVDLPGHAAALGQAKSPYQAETEKIARDFPGCFTGTEIVPVLRRAQTWANEVSTGGLSRYGGTATPEAVKADLARAVAGLQTWIETFQQNPSKKYCNTDNATKNDHWRVVQAVSRPYHLASGVAGAQATIAEARRQLYADLTSPSRWIPNLFDEYPWVVYGGIAAVAIGAAVLFSRKR